MQKEDGVQGQSAKEKIEEELKKVCYDVIVSCPLLISLDIIYRATFMRPWS